MEERVKYPQMLATYQCDRVSAYQQMVGTEFEVDHNDRDYPAHQPIDRLNAPFAFSENNFLSISRHFNEIRDRDIFTCAF